MLAPSQGPLVLIVVGPDEGFVDAFDGIIAAQDTTVSLRVSGQFKVIGFGLRNRELGDENADKC